MLAVATFRLEIGGVNVGHGTCYCDDLQRGGSVQRRVRRPRIGCTLSLDCVHEFRKHCSWFLAGTAYACSLDGVVT